MLSLVFAVAATAAATASSAPWWAAPDAAPAHHDADKSSGLSGAPATAPLQPDGALDTGLGIATDAGAFVNLSASFWKAPSFHNACTIPRLAALDVATFVRDFKGRAPVLFARDLSLTAGVRAATARRALAERYGHLPVTLASSNSYSYAKRRSTLRAYLAQQLRPQRLGVRASDTWYLFGDTPVTGEWAPLAEAYPLPLDAAADSGLVAWGLSAALHGVAFHTHGAAFAEVVHGAKRWFLSDPRRTPPRFDPNETMLTWAVERDARRLQQQRRRPPRQQPRWWRGANASAARAGPARSAPGGRADADAAAGGGAASAGEGSDDGDEERGGDDGDDDGVLECTAHVGEVLYIPPQWWHGTLNVGDYNAFFSVFTLEPFSLAAVPASGAAGAMSSTAAVAPASTVVATGGFPGR